VTALVGSVLWVTANRSATLPHSDVRASQPHSDVQANQPQSDVKAGPPQPDVKARQPRSEVRTRVTRSDVKILDKTERPSYSNAPAEKPEPVTTMGPPPPTLAGTWRDETYPNVVDQISQVGQSFRFVRTGMLPNGVFFESTGEGRIEGTHVSHRYQAQYQGGGFSSGGCSGNLTADGSRIVLQCSDSLLGRFPVVLVRR
jgi:hypothetical protein